MMSVRSINLFASSVRLDESAFEAIFREHYAKVYGVLFRLTGDRYEADDLTAETFWRLWEKPPALNSNIPGWLYRVATNLGYNRLRDRQRRQHYEEAALGAEGIEEMNNRSSGSDPERLAEEHQGRQRVRETLQQLPLRDVQLLVLRHSGFSYKEIAAAADISPASVGTLLARAEEKFEAMYRRGEKDAPER
jgi:RNA polymerase sigma-70 factor (ECF subfamily)